jgi:ABC-2 type transport system permease protein
VRCSRPPASSTSPTCWAQQDGPCPRGSPGPSTGRRVQAARRDADRRCPPRRGTARRGRARLAPADRAAAAHRHPAGCGRLLAASFGAAALYLVEDVEGGYLDKLRAAPVARSAIVVGRLLAEAAKSLLITALLVLVALPFGVRVASGVLGFVLLLLLTASWAVLYAGFMQLIALKTRSAAATNAGGLVLFPLLFLTPNVVPREQLTRPMEVAASLDPVTYLLEAMRSLILYDLAWSTVGRGFAVVTVLGVCIVALDVRLIRSYD